MIMNKNDFESALSQDRSKKDQMFNPNPNFLTNFDDKSANH